MKSLRILASALTLSCVSAMSVAADCTQPEVPNIPEGASATQDAMLAAQEDVRDFIAEGRQFLGCVKNKEAALAEKAGDDERQAIVTRYNTMVDQMKTTSNRFNKAVNDYQKTLEEDAE